MSAILRDKDRVLLGLRGDTQQFSGFWSLPVGHVEIGESDLKAIKRELGEELGIKNITATPYMIKTDLAESIYHQVFIVDDFDGKIVNLEPQLCKALEWFKLNNLPDNTTLITKQILSELKSDLRPNNL